MTDSPYSTIRHQQISVFPGEFSGSEEALFCVVSSKPLSSVEVASSAYNVPLTLEQRELLLGHGCCCFESFEELLKTTEGKQKAWKCLKTLPLLSVLQP